MLVYNFVFLIKELKYSIEIKIDSKRYIYIYAVDEYQIVKNISYDISDLMGVSMMHTDRTLPGARWLNRLTRIYQVPYCCTKDWY